VQPIPVPAPPRSAYNPNRRISDLLKSQLKHFQHIAQKRGSLGIEPAIARNIDTEAGAAHYIAAMTRALRGQAPAAAPKLAVVPAPKAVRKPAAEVTRIAAAASKPTTKSSKKKSAIPASKRKK
jgi:hypothetical protein